MRSSKYLFYILVFFQVEAIGQSWKNLITDDLKMWETLGGSATFVVLNGEIVGTTVENSPNTFLAYKEAHTDFILEFEVLVDPEINSGVQIRSNSMKKYNNGRVHGYQVELDPSSRAFSGGIYDEARRGWLYPLSRNEKGRKAFRNGVWNKVRVEAMGNYINTWINGVQCARLADDLTSSGFIALQVHGIGSPRLKGREIKWRNIRIITDNPGLYARTKDPEVPEVSYLVNRLTENEKRHGWRLLWDGKSGNGWTGTKSGHFPENGWDIGEGVLTISATDGGESTGPGDIITVEKFSDFELELEFKITEGANSGIKYFVDPALNKGQGSAIGCEFQILDDKKHPDAKKGINGNRTLGSLYDLIAAENLSIPGRSKQFKGVGAWNKARIVSKNGKVEHWLNGEKVVEYNRGDQIFRALVAYSKYKIWKNFGQLQEGHILLQDHGNEVHFRSIKIREF